MNSIVKNNPAPFNSYDTYWSETDSETFSKKFDSMWQFIPEDFESVLDLGGGDGSMYFSLSKKRRLGKSYHLVEYSNEAIEKANSLGVTTTKHNLDSEALPFKDGGFDLVILSDVLEHMNNPLALLAEAARVSKKYVFVHGPNFASLNCRLDALRGRPIREMVTDKNGSLVDAKGRKANHIYFITYRNLTFWAQKAGLEIKKSRVFWYRRYKPFRFLLEAFFKNFGNQYEIVFEKKRSPEANKNFIFYQ